jgi:hypothetical protein
MLASVSSSVRNKLLKSKYSYIYLICVIIYILQLGYLAMRKKIDWEICIIEAVIGLKFILLWIKTKVDNDNDISSEVGTSSTEPIES